MQRRLFLLVPTAGSDHARDREQEGELGNLRRPGRQRFASGGNGESGPARPPRDIAGYLSRSLSRLSTVWTSSRDVSMPCLPEIDNRSLVVDQGIRLGWNRVITAVSEQGLVRTHLMRPRGDSASQTLVSRRRTPKSCDRR